MRHLALLVCMSGLLAVSQARADSIIIGGQTTVTLDSSFVSLLGSNSLVPSPIAPATLVGVVATFPITGGTITGANLLIDHSGGLTFTKGSEFLSIGNFVVDTLNSDVIGFAKNGSGLNASSVPIFTIGSSLSLDLTATAAGAISSTFFSGDPKITTALTGFDIGVAAPQPVLTPEPDSLILIGTGLIGIVRVLRRNSTEQG